MPTTKATEAETAGGDFDDFDEDYDAAQAAYRQRREVVAKAEAADPATTLRKQATATVAMRRKAVDDLTADLRVARLELKAAEACLLALGPVPVVDEAPAPKKATKPAARRAGKAG